MFDRTDLDHAKSIRYHVMDGKRMRYLVWHETRKKLLPEEMHRLRKSVIQSPSKQVTVDEENDKLIGQLRGYKPEMWGQCPHLKVLCEILVLCVPYIDGMLLILKHPDIDKTRDHSSSKTRGHMLMKGSVQSSYRTPPLVLGNVTL